MASSCPAVFDQFRQHVEDFVQDLYGLTSPLMTFYNLIPRADYPKGIGLSRSVFTIGRSLPTTDEPEFETVATVNADTQPNGACSMTFNDVETGYFERTFVPEKFAWQGPVLCANDLVFDHQVQDFIPRYLEQMGHNTSWTIENRYAAIYDHLVPKAVANDDFHIVAGGTGNPGTSPNLTLDQSASEITQEMLDEVADQLIQTGAELDPGSGGWIDYGAQGVIFTLQIGNRASKRLFLNNAELREDVRKAYDGTQDQSPLLRKLGVARQLGNFKHLTTPFPPRYTYGGGHYTRVATWVTDGSVTKGFSVKLNPSYVSAPYEGARVLSPNVFTSEIIQPLGSAGGLTWPAQNFMGEWVFDVGGNNINDSHCLDPFKTYGRHFAQFWHAPRPVKPNYGILLIFLRCPAADFDTVSCGS